MSISANIFEKCLPAIGTSINSCGALTECDIVTATPDELEEIFTSDGDFRDMSSLLMTQFEIKACGTKQNGLFDFLMANAKPMKNRTIKTPLGFGNSEIAPFIMAETTSIINDKYWSIKESTDNGGGSVTFNVQSPGNVDLDLAWFPDDIRIFVFGTSAGGSAIRGSYKITNATASTYSGSPSIAVTATTQQGGSFLPTAKKSIPSAGFLVLGTPNIADVERWCENRPALNGRKHVPFWFETNRWTMCVDELYERAFERLRTNNDYFRLFGDIEVAQRNKQFAERFQRDWVNQVFWGKASSANQTLASYRSLPTISSVTSDIFNTGTEGKCVGRKADVIGIYEQLAQCNRVADLQGQQLNLEELFQAIYEIVRSRGDQGKPNKIVEIITDSYFASLFQRAMIRYFNAQSEGLARFMIDTKKIMTGQPGELGFTFDTYHLIWPQGVELRILTHDFFDDFVSIAKDEGVESTGRMLWILDWSGIYPGIIASNRVVHRTGALEDLAKIDASYACVMANPTSEISLNSITYTVVVECPLDNLIIEGIGTYIPDHTGKSATPSTEDYYSTYD